MRIGIIGKYVNLPDAYLSVVEALRHAGFHHGAKVELDWIQAEQVPDLLGTDRLRELDGIVIPGGFGERGIEGKIAAAGYAREHEHPVPRAVPRAPGHGHRGGPRPGRARAAPTRASSTAITPHPVIDLMDDQAEVVDMGGTMRLGSYQAALVPGSKVAQAYGTLGGVRAPPPPLRGQPPLPGQARGGRPGAARASRPTAGWSSSSSCPATRSGWAPRPTPSSRAGPTGPTRCSASSSAAALERAEGREPAPARPRRRHLRPPCPGFRRVSEEELLRAWLFRVDRFHLLDPDGKPFDRDVIRHPGAVAVVPRARRRHA